MIQPNKFDAGVGFLVVFTFAAIKSSLEGQHKEERSSERSCHVQSAIFGHHQTSRKQCLPGPTHHKHQSETEADMATAAASGD